MPSTGWYKNSLPPQKARGSAFFNIAPQTRGTTLACRIPPHAAKQFKSEKNIDFSVICTEVTLRSNLPSL